MIQRDLVLTINNNTASLNEPLIIYKHDRGITLRIKVLKYKFVFNRLMEEDMIVDSSIISARAIIRKPNGKWGECPRQEVEDDCVIINITLDWTDEDTEVGEYKLQLQLYGSDPVNERVSLPPFKFTVAEPIGYWEEEGVNYAAYADSAVVDISELTDELSGVEINEEDLANGIYNKTDWQPGDIITSDGLNKVETALNYLVGESTTHIKENVFKVTLNAYAKKTDIKDFATEQYVNDAIANIETDDVDLSGLATKGELELKADKSEIPSIEGLATEKYVDDAIANVQVGENVDLSDYALKSEIPMNTSQLTNDSNYITSSSLQAMKLVSSNTITRIEVVNELPSTEEDGVLYIVKG